MYKVSVAVLLLLNLSVASAARPDRVLVARKPQGTQFITGPCTSDGDCASGCCNAQTALCAARLVAEEGAGCGFGSGTAGADAASAAATSAAAAAPAVAPGTQFITGPCTSNADCASTCCGFKSGLCAARLVALETDGCGFGQATADFAKPGDTSGAANNAGAGAAAGAATTTSAAVDITASAIAALGTNTPSVINKAASIAIAQAASDSLKQAAGAATAAAGANNAGAGAAAAAAATSAPAAATSAAAAGSGKPPGTQFITGPCASDAECASGCCGFNSGKCAGAIVAQGRDGGCGFGDAQPNNNAAVALVGPSAPKPGQQS